MIVFLISGPPRVGKDTAVEQMQKIISANALGTALHEKMARPNKAAFAGMIKTEMDSNFCVRFYEDRKDKIITLLGVSYRQWQIDFSEKFMKPLYGKDVFGKLLWTRIWDTHHNYVLVSDCGFQEEIEVLTKFLGPHELYHIRLTRVETSYANDSRGPVWLPHPYTNFEVSNNNTVGALRDELYRIITNHR